LSTGPDDDEWRAPANVYQGAARLLDLALTAASTNQSAINEHARDYQLLRRFFITNETVSDGVPAPIIQHASLHGLAGWLQNERKSADARRNLVTKLFAPLQSAALAAEGVVAANDDRLEASAWTGTQTRAERLTVIRNLLPAARAAVESLIAALEQPGSNGGPLLDERGEAINDLRCLHLALGRLLEAVDEGGFEDDLGEGLAAEAVRYATRAAAALKNDPMPYAVAGLILALFSACGFPGAGGLVSSAALTFTKR
jgi:hypothetical protein